MNNIKVNLLHSTPKEVLLNAVGKPYKNEKVSMKLAHKVGKVLKHESTLEHVSFNFEILGISRGCLQELVRHRLSSLTVESSRFTLKKIVEENSEIEDYFTMPKTIMFEERLEYENYLKYTLKQLRKMINNYGTSNDKLKYFLPEAFRTNLTWSTNLRSLNNFLSLRLDEKAHFEIRHLANLIRVEVEKTDYKDFIGV